jgi:hypothetical protein
MRVTKGRDQGPGNRRVEGTRDEEFVPGLSTPGDMDQAKAKKDDYLAFYGPALAGPFKAEPK